MNRRNFLGALTLGGLGLTVVGASAAHAQYGYGRDPYDRYDDRYDDRYRGGRNDDPWDYRRYRYFGGRDRDDIRRREALRFRLFSLADRLRLADRQGDIPRGRASDLRRRLDDVRDFLRDDRNLSEREFDRRRDDLDDIAEDLNRSLRRGNRRDRWYDDYSTRYRRDSRYYRY